VRLNDDKASSVPNNLSCGDLNLSELNDACFFSQVLHFELVFPPKSELPLFNFFVQL